MVEGPSIAEGRAELDSWLLWLTECERVARVLGRAGQLQGRVRGDYWQHVISRYEEPRNSFPWPTLHRPSASTLNCALEDPRDDYRVVPCRRC